MAEFLDKAKKKLQNKIYDGGIADNQHMLVLPKNTTANLGEIVHVEGSLSYSTDDQVLMLDTGAGPTPISGGGSGANQQLSNLSGTTDINIALLSSDNVDLGDGSGNAFGNAYIDGSIYDSSNRKAFTLATRQLFASDGSTLLMNLAGPKVQLGTSSLQWPNVDGAVGQSLITNGAGILDWSYSNAAFEYSVGPGQQFATIQSAISQGISDGVNGTQKGLITIYPQVNSAPYVENLSLAQGFTFKSASAFAFNNAVVIEGQHSYVAPGGGDPFANDVCFVQLSFTSASGSIFTTTGNDALNIFNNCKFQLNGASGRAIDYNAAGFSVMVMFGCSAGSTSTDEVISFNGAVTFIKETDMTFLSGPGAYINAGFFSVIANNQILSSGPYILEIDGGGQNNLQGNLLSSDAGNANGLIVDSGATCSIFNSTISIPAGSGYVMSGAGAVNGALNSFPGGNSTVDPGLVLNIQPVSAVVSPVRIITGNDTLSAANDKKIIFNDASASVFNLNLPLGQEGLTFGFGSAAASTSTWTLVPSGGDTIDASFGGVIGVGPTSMVFASGVWYLCY